MTGENYEIQAIAAHPNGGCVGVFRIEATTGVRIGLLEFNRDREHPIERPVADFPSDHINQLTVTHDGSIYLGGRRGIHLVQENNYRLISRIKQPIEDQINFITALWQLDGDRVWYTQSNRMVLSTEGATSIIEDRPFHLPEFSVNAHLKDREGNHWLGTGRNGVIKLRPRSFQTIGKAHGIQNDNIYSVCEGVDASILIGTSYGYYIVPPDLSVVHYNQNSIRMRLRSAATIHSDPYGQIWVGNGDGLELIVDGKPYQFDGTVGSQQFSPYNEETGVVSIYQSQDKELWIGTQHGVFRVNANTNPVRLDTDTTDLIDKFHIPDLEQIHLRDKLGEAIKPEARTFLKSSEGSIWIGTKQHGIFRLDKDLIVHYTEEDGLPANHGWALYEDQEHRIWVGTEEGLACLDGSTFRSLTTTNGLVENVINAILEDNYGQVWIAGLKGIYRLPQEELSQAAKAPFAELFPIQYNELDGMASSETNGGRQNVACKLSDGRLCFATVRGLSIVAPKKAVSNDFPPHTLVEEVRVNRETLYRYHRSNLDQPSKTRRTISQEQGVWIFPPGSGGFIEFVFTANTFATNHRVRFAYRLKGHDTVEIKATDRRHASYTNLPPGEYEFEVRASNSHGVWNQPSDAASFTFRILPHFYQTKEFLWLLVIGSFGLIGMCHFGIVHFRLKQERLRTDLQQMKSRIKLSRDLHDDLGTGLTRISLLSETCKDEVTLARVQKDIGKIASQARELSTSLSDIVWMTNPRNQRLDELVIHLRHMTAEVLEEAQIDFKLQIPSASPKTSLNPEQLQNIYLIVKEILANVIKHSQATQVCFGIENHSNQLTISVADNGTGITPSHSPPGHNGLNNIQARATEIGGRVELTGEKGQGTKVRLTVSLTP